MNEWIESTRTDENLESDSPAASRGGVCLTAPCLAHLPSRKRSLTMGAVAPGPAPLAGSAAWSNVSPSSSAVNMPPRGLCLGSDKPFECCSLNSVDEVMGVCHCDLWTWPSLRGGLDVVPVCSPRFVCWNLVPSVAVLRGNGTFIRWAPVGIDQVIGSLSLGRDEGSSLHPW